jgi:pimeloyl-ACP methyl ester carboxylesterase
MRLLRTLLIACVAAVLVWLGLCGAIGVIMGESAFHPIRRAVTADDEARAAAMAQRDDASLASVSIRADDGARLQAWRIQPAQWKGDYVLLLHGQGDNRAGMLGPADMLLRHGYTVLLPDARAHGTSDGAIATYGVMERKDIRDWFDAIARTQRPRCIDAIGDSMGAAQLLESLSAEPGFCAVIAESPFATFREAAYDRIGQQLGTGPWAGRTFLRPAVEWGFLYARLKYDIAFDSAMPAASVAQSVVPVLLIHGLKDDNLPPRHSEMIMLQNSGRDPNVALWEPANAGHCGASTADPEEYEQRVIDWFEVHDRHLNPATQAN